MIACSRVFCHRATRIGWPMPGRKPMSCRTSKRHFFCLIVVLFLAATSNGLFGQMLYVGNNGDDTISAYVIDQQSGLLTELLPRVPSTGAPSSVTVHPNHKFVYVTNFGNGALG